MGSWSNRGLFFVWGAGMFAMNQELKDAILNFRRSWNWVHVSGLEGAYTLSSPYSILFPSLCLAPCLHTDQDVRTTGDWKPAGKLSRTMKWFPQCQLLGRFQVFRVASRRLWPLGGVSGSGCAGKQGGAQGPCPVTCTKSLLHALCPGCENCRWRSQKENKWMYRAPSEYPLRRECFSCPLLRWSIWSSGKNLLKFIFATGDSWRELFLDAKEKPGNHQDSFQDGNFVLAVGFPSFPSGCEDLARAWSQSRLS